ncbi:MAG: tetratricopeptide repeat protein [Nitrospinae bacterium]|nr:tetratricopeptide repeat protein [Nitrospinota bacterium]
MPDIDEKLLRAFGELVSVKIGLRPRPGDENILRSAILTRIKSGKSRSPEEYYQLVDSDTEQGQLERHELAAHFTVGETYFFRDRGQFALIRSVILPEIIKRRGEDKTLRIWSAGCATGEEPYSLAMVLDELIPKNSGWEAMILGSDVREDFLAKARGGIFGEWSFRSISKDGRNKYFKKLNERQWELRGHIRKMVTFRAADLAGADYPEGMDLILCRNLLLYYERNFVTAIVNKLSAALGDGGYLITGHGELFSTPVEGLSHKVYPESVVYQKTSGQAQPSMALVAPKTRGEPVFQNFIQIPEPHIISAPVRYVPPAGNEDPAPEPESPQDPFKGLEAALEQGRYQEAAAKAENILRDAPGSVKALCYAARAMANTGDHKTAAAYLERAVAADWNSVEPHYLLANIAEENGDRAKAKEELNKVIYLAPKYIPAYMDMAAIHENENDFDRARKMRLSALAVLKAGPEKALIAPYGNMTAKELINHLEKMLEEGLAV